MMPAMENTADRLIVIGKGKLIADCLMEKFTARAAASSRTGNALRVMGSPRTPAISLLRLDGHASIAAASRHHARDPQRTLMLSHAA